MNDSIEHVFKYWDEPELPEGPPEELIQATLMAVREQTRNVATARRTRRQAILLTVAAAAVLALGLTLFTLRDSHTQNRPSELSIQPQPLLPATNVTTAFIEADQLKDGQTFLLPLHGAPVRVDPATWPDDLLITNSSAES